MKNDLVKCPICDIEFIKKTYHAKYCSKKCKRKNDSSQHYKKYHKSKVEKVTEEDFLEGEVWEDIEGYEGGYKVSNKGRVRSLDRRIDSGNKSQKCVGKIFVGKVNKFGYLTVTISVNSKKKNLSVHRLVAQSFIPNPKNKPQVNHIDGNKLNNNVENLEWCTAQENIRHAWENGLMKKCEGKNSYLFGMHPDLNHRSKKVMCSKTLKTWGSVKSASKELGFKYGNLCKMLNGRAKNKTSLKFVEQ